MLHFDWKDYEVNGMNNLLCVIPVIDTESILTVAGICASELSFQIASYNQGIDLINDLCRLVHVG